MQKKWLWSIILCVFCVVCLLGNCGAAAKNENWVRFYGDDWDDYCVDVNSLKITEYNGRKYLDARMKYKVTRDKMVYKRVTTYGEWHALYDIGRSRYTYLEYFNDAWKPKRGRTDISSINNGWAIDWMGKRLVEWVASNHPEIIDEIMEFNQDKSLYYLAESAVFMVTKNTSGVGGKYLLQSEDGLMGITFDYKPESNLLLLYDLNEAKPYSSQKYISWNRMKRNSADMHDQWNGEYIYNGKQFAHMENKGTFIFAWETDGLQTFLRTRAWKHL